MKATLSFAFGVLGLLVAKAKAAPNPKPLNAEVRVALHINSHSTNGTFGRGANFAKSWDTQLSDVICPNLNVKGADYQDCNGIYQVTGEKVSWAPNRPVYKHAYKDRYIFWDTDATIPPPTTYGWSIGNKLSLTAKDVYHKSGEPGLDTEEPWQGQWGNGSVVVKCIKYIPVDVDNLVQTFHRWGPQFQINFSILLKKLSPEQEWINFFHVTSTDTDCCLPGSRIPGVWFIQIDSINYMHVGYANEDGNVDKQIYFSQGNLEINRWYHVKMEQKVLDWAETKARLTMEINGEIVWQLDTNANQYSNVKLYRSDPWWPSLEDKVKVSSLTIDPY